MILTLFDILLNQIIDEQQPDLTQLNDKKIAIQLSDVRLSFVLVFVDNKAVVMSSNTKQLLIDIDIEMTASALIQHFNDEKDIMDNDAVFIHGDLKVAKALFSLMTTAESYVKNQLINALNNALRLVNKTLSTLNKSGNET